MCLTIKNYKPNSVAEKDITVYKVLVKREEIERQLQEYLREDARYFYDYISRYEAALKHDAPYFTPYQLAPVTIGDTKEVTLVVEEFDYRLSGTIDYFVNQGLHSFTTKEHAFKLFYDLSIVSIVECTIPKGSVVHFGNFLKYGDSCASNKLVYVKEVPAP